METFVTHETTRTVMLQIYIRNKHPETLDIRMMSRGPNFLLYQSVESYLGNKFPENSEFPQTFAGPNFNGVL